MARTPDVYGTVTYVKVAPFPTLTVKFRDTRTGEQKEEPFPCKNRATAYKYVERDQVGLSLMSVTFLPRGLQEAIAQWMLSEEVDA